MYEQVYFAQGEFADEAMDILDEEGVDAAMDYLLDWWYPGEHDERDTHSYADGDHTYRRRIDDNTVAVMAWNSGLPYIGLEVYHHD